MKTTSTDRKRRSKGEGGREEVVEAICMVDEALASHCSLPIIPASHFCLTPLCVLIRKELMHNHAYFQLKYPYPWKGCEWVHPDPYSFSQVTDMPTSYYDRIEPKREE